MERTEWAALVRKARMGNREAILTIYQNLDKLQDPEKFLARPYYPKPVGRGILVPAIWKFSAELTKAANSPLSGSRADGFQWHTITGR